MERVGIYEFGKKTWIEVLEGRAFHTHRHFRGSMSGSDRIEDGFRAGPIYAVYSDSYVDIVAGLTLVDNMPIRQTAVVRKLIDGYPVPKAEEIQTARDLDPASIVLPLASQRTRNYCRWWLDSVAKLFICSKSRLLQANRRGSTLEIVMPKTQTSFQRQTVDAIQWPCRVSVEKRTRLLRGRSINSSGLAFGGGQNIGSLVREFSQFLDILIPADRTHNEGERLFISRNETSMRRICNEDALIPGLRDLGFTILQPAQMTLKDQIAMFRNARVVLAAHGAGLTNIVFCRPGTTLIEIFPEGGVHPSAFFRMASHLDFNYYYAAGERVENPHSSLNERNADILLNVPSFLQFVKEALH